MNADSTGDLLLAFITHRMTMRDFFLLSRHASSAGLKKSTAKVNSAVWSRATKLCITMQHLSISTAGDTAADPIK